MVIVLNSPTREKAGRLIRAVVTGVHRGELPYSL